MTVFSARILTLTLVLLVLFAQVRARDCVSKLTVKEGKGRGGEAGGEGWRHARQAWGRVDGEMWTFYVVNTKLDFFRFHLVPSTTTTHNQKFAR